jgi:hypothetical protein
VVCIVCNRKINFGEQVFFGNQVEYCGPGEDDCSYSGAMEGLMGAVHLSCLDRPAGVAETQNTAVPETESVVERSDALSIFD